MKNAIFVIFLLLAACAPQVTEDSDKLNVVVSFYPLQYFTEQIGREHVQINNLVPPGVGTHDWEPTPQNIASINNADVFIYNGLGEFWAESLVPGIPSSVLKVPVSTGVQLIANEEEHEDEDEHHEEGERHEEGLYDPHIWLDPVLVQQQADTIAQALIAKDPAHAADYERNLAEFKQNLVELDENFKISLSSCAQDKVITSHFAFRYIANRYGFDQASITGLFHEEEPSAESIARMVDYARANSIKYIFFETLLSPRIAETIAKEINGQTLVLNPVEGLTSEEIASGQNWMTIMEQNLKNLHIALECQ